MSALDNAEDFIAATCEGKATLSAQQAKTAARKMRKKKGAKVRAYKCPVCEKWHVGTATDTASSREHAETWTARPDRERDRPTYERKAKGEALIRRGVWRR